MKKAESKWWSRLLKQEGKPPLFLKADWDKWVDEDEQDEKRNYCETVVCVFKLLGDFWFLTWLSILQLLLLTWILEILTFL